MASILNVDKIRAASGTTNVIDIDSSCNTTALTVDSSGRVLFPQIACACVTLTTSNTQDTSNPYTTTGTAILFDKVSVQGNCFTHQTEDLDSLLVGIYEYLFSVLKHTNSNTTYVDMYKNGSAFTESGGRGYGSVSGYLQISQKLLLSLAVNDYLTLRLMSGAINLNASGVNHSIVFKLVG